MTRFKKQKYKCRVVNEQVIIWLRKRPSAGFMSRSEYFVQCNQDECQFVDSNDLPCPLSLSMFEQEILDRDEEAQRRRDDAEHFR